MAKSNNEALQRGLHIPMDINYFLIKCLIKSLFLLSLPNIMLNRGGGRGIVELPHLPIIYQLLIKRRLDIYVVTLYDNKFLTMKQSSHTLLTATLDFRFIYFLFLTNFTYTNRFNVSFFKKSIILIHTSVHMLLYIYW